MPRFCARVCVFLVMMCSAAAASAASGDVVLYASDATSLHGNWSKQPDPTAAGGQLLASPDNGWSSPNTPLATPVDYVDFTFSAPANTSYHMWVRLRAGGNSKYNDSVFAQFSDAASTSGSAVYRLNTTSALNLNLQRCSGCALSGWGWMDGAYWLVQTSTVRFASTGSHTLRIQTREDGVQLDQVVLSPSAYLSQAPGSVTDDATIVAKASSGGSSGGSTGGSTPFSGTPATIPGTIRTQDFDNGGEGVAYHDTTSGNTGGAYRATDVDLEPSSDGGNDVGWISASEWLNYSVNVGASGTYTLTLRVASAGQGGSLHLEVNGVNVSGSITIPDTGGWQNWQSVTRSVTLTAGMQVARLVMDSAGSSGAVGNVNSMQFSQSSGGTTSSSTPYSGSPVAIPGTIQAENFDNGGEGVAYHDTTAGNSGGAYRSTGVDLEAASSGGYDVGWTAPGEWLNYTVNVASAGSYTVTFRVASLGQGGTFHLEMNGASVTGSLTVPNTGDWQNWQTITATVSLNAGVQIARLVMDTNGSVAVGNFDSMQMTASTTSGGGGSTGGATTKVPAGSNLQTAIDAAQPGDTLLLDPGATYSGSFVLTAKSGSSYVTIRSAASDSSLPGDGVRIGPQYASLLPKIQGGFAGQPAFTTAPGAHHYKLQFLEIVNTYAHNDIIQLGDGSGAQNSLSLVPHDLVLDRVYIHGDATNGQKRGIALNSASTTIANSYISDIKSKQEDAQAIAAWNGPGPFTIVNNYLEATGENVLMGGSDPAIANLVSSDITLRQNHITKQLSWRGQGWTVKNLIELKNAQRVVIDDNLIEYSWADAQLGYAFMLTPVNQDGGAPWAVVQHVQITNNLVRHVGAGVNILGLDPATSQTTNDIVVRNNVFDDISHANWGGPAYFVLTQGGANVVLDHNTVFTDGSSVLYADVAPVSGLVFTNNIVPDNVWAIMGSNASPGNGTIAMFYPGASVLRNVFIGGNSSTYPSANYYPPTISDVRFVDVSSGDYHLSSSSPYINGATDGSAVGCNVDTVNR